MKNENDPRRLEPRARGEAAPPQGSSGWLLIGGQTFDEVVEIPRISLRRVLSCSWVALALLTAAEWSGLAGSHSDTVDSTKQM